MIQEFERVRHLLLEDIARNPTDRLTWGAYIGGIQDENYVDELEAFYMRVRSNAHLAATLSSIGDNLTPEILDIVMRCDAKQQEAMYRMRRRLTPEVLHSFVASAVAQEDMREAALHNDGDYFSQVREMISEHYDTLGENADVVMQSVGTGREYSALNGNMVIAVDKVGNVSLTCSPQELLMGDTAQWAIETLGVQALVLRDVRGNAQLQQCLASPALTQLHSLSILRANYADRETQVDDAGVNILSVCPYLSGLRHLCLNHHYIIGADGAQAIATSPFLQGLENLELCGTMIEDEGVLALTNPSTLEQLRKLKIPTNQITDGCLDGIITHLRQRTNFELDAGSNTISITGYGRLRMAAAASRNAGRNITINKWDDDRAPDPQADHVEISPHRHGQVQDMPRGLHPGIQ